MELKCLRCGKNFNPEDGCVDVFYKRKLTSVNFTVKNHGVCSDTPFAILCLDCLGNWLGDSGVEKVKANQIKEQYRPKIMEGKYVVG